MVSLASLAQPQKRIKEYFQRVDESIGIHPLTLWSALNAPYLSDGFDFSYMNPLGLGLIDSLDMYVFERSKYQEPKFFCFLIALIE